MFLYKLKRGRYTTTTFLNSQYQPIKSSVSWVLMANCQIRKHPQKLHKQLSVKRTLTNLTATLLRFLTSLVHSPGPAHACRDQLSPEIWPPSGQHRRRSDPPLCSPSQKKLRPHGHPNPRKCRQWSYAQSDQHHPAEKITKIESKTFCLTSFMPSKAFRNRCLNIFLEGLDQTVVTKLYAVQENKRLPFLKMFLSHLRSSNDKATTGLQMVYGFIIQVLTGNYRFHHLLLQTMAHLFQTYTLVVLHRHHNGVDTQWYHRTAILPVLDSHLKEKEIF